MADFSLNDIDEAKRRVQQMRNRARDFVEDAPREIIAEEENSIQQEQHSDGIGGLISSLFSSNDSSIILAIVLILAHEKADNMLILALLYILL